MCHPTLAPGRRGATQHRIETTVEITGQLDGRRRGSGRVRSNHEHSSRRKPMKPLPREMPQPALDPIAGHRRPDHPRDDETHPGRPAVLAAHSQVDDK